MDMSALKREMTTLIGLCEEMGLCPFKNGLGEPGDLEAARKAVTRLYIVSANLHDVARKARDTTLLLSSTKLKTCSENILKLLLVEGLSDLLPQPPEQSLIRIQ